MHQISKMQRLFKTPPYKSLRAKIIAPVKDEEANLYVVPGALRGQVNPMDKKISNEVYELWLRANCTY